MDAATNSNFIHIITIRDKDGNIKEKFILNKDGTETKVQ
jgi:hypothetical protein